MNKHKQKKEPVRMVPFFMMKFFKPVSNQDFQTILLEHPYKF